MSAIRLTQPTRSQQQGFRAITGGKLAAMMGTGTKSKSRIVFVLTILGGLMAIQILQLALSVGVTDATYALADLKKERDQLVMQQEILAEEVDSLASNQNLANTAQKMGMVSNANPVFLRLSDQRVFGKPKAALNADNRLSRNLIPSATLTVTSNLVDEATTAEAQASALLPAGSLTLVPVTTAPVTTSTKAAAPGAGSLTLVPSTKTANTVATTATGSLPVQVNH